MLSGEKIDRSHTDKAQRKPMLCLRTTGLSPVANWHVAWPSK